MDLLLVSHCSAPQLILAEKGNGDFVGGVVGEGFAWLILLVVVPAQK